MSMSGIKTWRETSMIVTGGASGIGLGCVDGCWLKAGGWSSPIATRRRWSCFSAGSSRRTDDGGARRHRRVGGRGFDRRDRAEVAPLAGVVNSAGIGRDVPFVETTAELFPEIDEINVVGSFLESRRPCGA